MAGRCLPRVSRQWWLVGKWLSGRRYSSLAPAVNVQDERVQNLLSQMTGLDLDKVFSPRREPLQPPTYKLMTLQQLDKAHAECVEEAKQLLRMPPVLPERPPKGDVIAVDERLDKAIKHRMIFTDTTQHIEDKDRQIVVREVNGTLREAEWTERDRMCQLFFPKLGRKMWLPKMLHSHQLPEVLGLGHHLTVLDCVCVQCAPDSKEYIRVHKAVYEDIDKKGLYEMLWSTKYFGCLVWHLLCSDNVIGLLKHMLIKQRLPDAGGLMRLYLLCYPRSEFAATLKEQAMSEKDSDSSLVETFCRCYGLREHAEKVSEVTTDCGHDKNNDTKNHHNLSNTA